MSKGSSGIRISAGPRRRCPSTSRSSPACRPMTSHTITRSCDSAVVCSRSMASVAICTAVSKPNVTSVADRSLSIVFGTPTTRDALAVELVRHAERVFAADRDERVDPLVDRASASPRRRRRRPCRGSCRDEPSTVPPRGRLPRMTCDVERHRAALDHAPPSVEEADELVAVDGLALAHHGPDDRVEPGQSPPPVSSPTRIACTLRGATRSPVPCPRRWPVLVAIDAGTTGVRAFAIGDDGLPRGWSYREFTQHFPQPGWVEHDASRSGQVTQETLAELSSRLDEPIAAIGITNQRETDRGLGSPHRPARCTERSCGRTGARPSVATSCATPATSTSCGRRTGLVLDPYFSATKLEWIIRSGIGRHRPRRSRSARSTRGSSGTSRVARRTSPTRRTRAARCSSTSRALAWSDELLDLFSVPRSMLPEVRPSSGTVGATVDGTGVAGGPPDQRHRRRPAGRAVRPGLLLARA